MTALSRRDAVLVFLPFAFTFFFSSLIRAITATLSPLLTREFELQAGELGLLAGGYFLGFAVMQLPLGRWLDRYGPKKVLRAFLAIAVAACLTFAASHSFTALLAARVLSGIGLAATLMAPLTGYRRWFTPAAQLRANSWMLMTGALGMVASTLPVQWLLPVVGWRGLFVGLAAMLSVSLLVIARSVPDWHAPAPAPATTGGGHSYAAIWRNRYFRSMTPLGFVNYGGMIAVQTLWAVPWMTRVCGYTPAQAASALFGLNAAMLVTFWSWGLAMPRLTRMGWPAERLIAWGTPMSMAVLALIVIGGNRWGPAMGAMWALFCVSSTFLSLAQPSVAMAFPHELAGRALSAYNLVIFGGVFSVQWGVGLLIDAAQAMHWSYADAFRGALAVQCLLSAAAYVYFLATRRHNLASPQTS